MKKSPTSIDYSFYGTLEKFFEEKLKEICDEIDSGEIYSFARLNTIIKDIEKENLNHYNSDYDSDYDD